MRCGLAFSKYVEWRIVCQNATIVSLNETCGGNTCSYEAVVLWLQTISYT